jgi:hypothetical protein
MRVIAAMSLGSAGRMESGILSRDRPGAGHPRVYSARVLKTWMANATD